MPEDNDIDVNVSKKEGVTLKLRWHYVITAVIGLLTAAIAPHFVFNWKSTNTSTVDSAIIKKLDRQEYQLEQQKYEIQQLKEREETCERLLDRLINGTAPDTTKRVRPRPEGM